MILHDAFHFLYRVWGGDSLLSTSILPRTSMQDLARAHILWAVRTSAKSRIFREVVSAAAAAAAK